ncbi:MAG TPA: glutaredoxin family protein [Thiotrichaceae bacterium]|jgi:thiol-disulfide isomerase/thioredoxin|nr:glutaredoxin family protein [Thiotrichaceae bacterium]HIM08598.1 glutaredoxin family protein [Gammaproteobacteria bacterium]
MSETELVLSLYSRAECHLCEEMLDALKQWQNRFDFRVNVIDIDQNSSLTERFAARIPLLALGDIEICEYFLDEAAFLDIFESKNSL